MNIPAIGRNCGAKESATDFVKRNKNGIEEASRPAFHRSRQILV
jgi:hypothetical protein